MEVFGPMADICQLAASLKMVRLLIILLTISGSSCTNRNTRIDDSCAEIIESDTFYWTQPLNVPAYKAMYRTENYLTEIDDSQALVIDFDCAIVVSPTDEQIAELKRTIGQGSDESVKISTRHCEAIRCMIESKGIRTFWPTRQFIRFETGTRTWGLDVRRDSFPDWKFILFKRGKDPVILPSLTLTIEDIDQYLLIAE